MHGSRPVARCAGLWAGARSRYNSLSGPGCAVVRLIAPSSLIEERREDQGDRAYRDQFADEEAGANGRRNRRARRQCPGAGRIRGRRRRLGRGCFGAHHDRGNRSQHDGGAGPYDARPAWAGSSDDFAGVSAAMDARIYGNSGAKAAIEIALHDLVGRATGRPVYELLGAKQRSRMPVLAVIGSEDAAADLRDAESRYAAGYRAFKIKVGLDTPEADAVRTRIVCAALKRQAESLPRLGRRQSGFCRRRRAALRAGGGRLRARFFRAAGRSPCA